MPRLGQAGDDLHGDAHGHRARRGRRAGAARRDSRSSCRALTSGAAEGGSRAEFLAELVALRRSIVVGGAHGKTTTAAMIAYVLRELGHDPAWIIGGVVPQLGGNAGVGAGWLVVEGDESDRSIALLRPEIAVVTNVEVDHHAAFASEAELERSSTSGSRDVPAVVRGWELEPVDVRARGPGRAQPAERRRRARRARAGRRRRDPRRSERSRASRASDDGSSWSATEGGVRVYDDYAHNPTEIAATLETARERTERRLIAVYQPHVYERTRQLSSRARRRARARGRGGRDRRDRRARRASAGSHREARARQRAGGCPARLGADARRRGSARARVGSAGRRRRHARRRGAVEASRGRSSRGCASEPRARRPALAADDDRHGRAGAARSPGRGRSPSSSEALRLRRGRGPRGRRRRARVEPARRGRGRRRARAPPRGRARRGRGGRRRCLVAGGGATNAVCLHRARAAGLGGFEFACAIPGTAAAGCG